MDHYLLCWQTSTSMNLIGRCTAEGVKLVRYADDIVVFAKSKRAAERLLESCRKYLEVRLKLKVNTEKSKRMHRAEVS